MNASTDVQIQPGVLGTGNAGFFQRLVGPVVGAVVGAGPKSGGAMIFADADVGHSAAGSFQELMSLPSKATPRTSSPQLIFHRRTARLHRCFTRKGEVMNIDLNSNICRLTILSLFSVLLSADARGDDKATKNPPEVAPRIGVRETIHLFNGKDLAGWVGHAKYWSVRDDMIVGRNDEDVPVSTYLLTKRKFTDFRLTFDFRLAESEMHSGIAHWGRVAPEHGDPFTYAGHLTMFPSGYGIYDLYGRKWLGVENAALARQYGEQHGWNNMEILAQGNRIRHVLNGHLIADWRDPEPDRILEGPIGLQLHSNTVPQEVQFKNLTLETFPEEKLTTLKK